MTAREFLNQGFRIELRIQKKQEELEAWETLAEHCTPSYEPRAGKSDPNIHKLEATIERIDDIREQILEEIQELADIKAKINYVLSQLPDPQERTVLELQYRNGESLKEVADDIHMSYSYTRELAFNGIAHLQPILDRQYYI